MVTMAAAPKLGVFVSIPATGQPGQWSHAPPRGLKSSSEDTQSKRGSHLWGIQNEEAFRCLNHNGCFRTNRESGFGEIP